MYRDPVRASHGHFVKAQGLRWVKPEAVGRVPWARRVWALPCLTVRAPSRRYHAARSRRHKTITDWARPRRCRLHRWPPARELVVIADRTCAPLKLLAACQALTPPLTCLTRLRLDAGRLAPSPPRRSGQMGRPRSVGARQPCRQAVLTDPDTQWTALRPRDPTGSRAPQALLCTDPDWTPTAILTAYLTRGPVEVTPNSPKRPPPPPPPLLAALGYSA